MKHFSKWICAAMATAILSACSNDLDRSENYVDLRDGDGVFMKLNIALPSSGGTRSYTDGENSSNDGTEVGQDYENNVNEVRIVLAATDNSYIADALISSDKLMKVGTEEEYRATSKFTKTALQSYYDADWFKRDVRIFLFVNPNKGITDVLNNASLGDSDWYQAVCKVSNDNPISSKANNGSFVMSNVSIATRSLPESMDKWSAYTTEATAFDLSGINQAGTADEVDNESNNRGPVRVHRMAARFDFKDGSPLGDNTYNVVFGPKNEDGSDGEPIVQVKLGKMSLVNVNNSEYYLERVSANGLNTNATICGAELPWYQDATGTTLAKDGNYVVDVWAQQKYNRITSGFSTYFTNPFFNDEGTLADASTRWQPAGYSIDDVLKGASDNYGSKQYHIWTYAPENTTPAPTNRQTNGVSTGVVFKGRMIATEAAKNSDDESQQLLYETLNNVGGKLGNPGKDPIIFQYNGSLYVSWANMRDAAIAASFDPETETWNRSNSLYVAVFGTGGTGYSFIKTEAGAGQEAEVYTDPLEQDVNSPNYLFNVWENAGRPTTGTAITAFKKAATDATITIYQSSNDASMGGWGYYCYYYYWNRHNYNGDTGIMGPMEFAVVRNNVYKLAVTNIHQLGHPRTPENDPDSPTPDTPDESSDVYMTVTAEVIPWVVRINDIEF